MGGSLFRGRYEHTIDDKGRTSLPAKFREILVASYDERLIVTTNFDTCLVAYPFAEWQAFEEKVAALPRYDRNVIALKRFLIANAIECPFDKLGRIILPPALREYAELDKVAIWTGQVNCIEIWSKARWGREWEASARTLKRNPKGLAGLGL
ncbi:MAG: division/cell wall cluster transcriptional repressor MraZ [Deltaproteobacteria bacterium]|nr:division/cell wall cluster transcriptional repressor MraZ [Deltaproteobacteria bacterium]